MAENISYQIDADPEQVKRALKEIEASAERVGREIAKALGEGGRKGAADLGKNVERGIRDSEGRAKGAGNFVGITVGKAIGAALVAGAAAGLKGLFDNLKEIDDLAKKTGLSAGRIGAIQNVGLGEGIGAGDINKGLDALGAKANEEFREKEGDLTKLLEANNLKLTDRAGKLKDSNALLEDAARLVANANTEFDKIDIAKAFGLTEDWVKILEKGPEALRASIAEAEALGGAVDAELVAKAKAFDEAWNSAIASWTITIKAAIADVGGALGALIAQARDLASSVAAAAKPLQFEAGAYAGKRERTERFNQALRDGRPQAVRDIIAADTSEARREASRAAGLSGLPSFDQVDLPIPPERPAGLRGRGTRIPRSGGGGGGGGGGKSEADTAESRLERYTEALQRQGDVLQAQIATFGLSNAEQKAAIELARAKVDLDKVDAETKARLTEGITKAVTANEQYRESLERLKGAQEAAKSVAGDLADALGDVVLDGQNASDALRSLLKNFARQALQGAFAGSGSFANLFGTSQSGGIFGALLRPLFGGIAGRADGGELPRGLTLVGERGPELLRNSGSGVARVYPSGQGGASGMGGMSVVMNNDFRGADQGAVAQIGARLNALQQSLPAQIAAVARRQQVRGYA